ncbi:MAG: YigZ family protein [Clostridia bacterium]
MQDFESLKPYRTIRKSSEAEIVIQKSRFIGRCFPFDNEQETIRQLETVKKQNWDARHHCYAFRLGVNGGTARSSDDGEPSGTAGMPILHVLLQNELTNVLCVVTRYFGGILLGAGGLIRAYTGAAVQAVEAADIVQMAPAMLFDLTVSYPLWASLERLLHQTAEIVQTQYSDVVCATFFVFEDAVDVLLARIRDGSDGKATPILRQNVMRQQ